MSVLPNNSCRKTQALPCWAFAHIAFAILWSHWDFCDMQWDQDRTAGNNLKLCTIGYIQYILPFWGGGEMPCRELPIFWDLFSLKSHAAAGFPFLQLNYQFLNNGRCFWKPENSDRDKTIKITRLKFGHSSVWLKWQKACGCWHVVQHL